MVWKEAIAHQLLAAVSAHSCTKCGMHETSVNTISARTQIRTGYITNINQNSVRYSDWASVKTIRDSIPDWGSRISSSPKTSRPALGLTQLPIR